MASLEIHKKTLYELRKKHITNKIPFKIQTNLFKFLVKTYNKTPLIKEIYKHIKKNKENETINDNIFIDIHKAPESHILLYLRLVLNKSLFKNKIIIVGLTEHGGFNIYKETNKPFNLSFIIEAKKLLKLKTDETKEAKFIYFCNELIGIFNKNDFECVYCLEGFNDKYYRCGSCFSILCFECYKQDFLKNSDALFMNGKICSICKKTGKYYFNTEFNGYDEFKQKEEKIEELKFKIMYDEAEENDMDDAFNDFMLNNIRRFNNFMDSLDIDN
jgi:hypothetical protein